MSAPDAATAASLFREFLDGNTIVSILVLPGLCTGLAEFERNKPLRIDLSEAFSPPMWPQVSEDGLAFRASFSRVDRAVTVPWCALVWAGIPGAPGAVAVSQDKLAALDAPDVTKPQVRDGGQLIHVDFASRKRSTQ